MVLSAYLLNNAQNHIAFATRRCKKQDKKMTFTSSQHKTNGFDRHGWYKNAIYAKMKYTCNLKAAYSGRSLHDYSI